MARMYENSAPLNTAVARPQGKEQSKGEHSWG